MKKTIYFLFLIVLSFILLLQLVSCGKEYISGTYRAEVSQTTEVFVVFHDDGTMDQTIMINGESRPTQHLNYQISNDKIRVWSQSSKDKDLKDDFKQASDEIGNYIEYGGFKYYQVD